MSDRSFARRVQISRNSIMGTRHFAVIYAVGSDGSILTPTFSWSGYLRYNGQIMAKNAMKPIPRCACPSPSCISTRKIWLAVRGFSPPNVSLRNARRQRPNDCSCSSAVRPVHTGTKLWINSLQSFCSRSRCESPSSQRRRRRTRRSRCTVRQHRLCVSRSNPAGGGSSSRSQVGKSFCEVLLGPRTVTGAVSMVFTGSWRMASICRIRCRY